MCNRSLRNRTRQVSLLSRLFFLARRLGTGALASVFLACLAHAQELRIDITQGQIEPTSIAVLPFEASDARYADYGRGLVGLVIADLERSGLFASLAPASFIQRSLSLESPPRFGDWRVINAQILLNGRVEGDGQNINRLKISFRLWDVFAGRQIEALAIRSPESEWRQAAHKIADSVYKQLTGEEGYFNSRILYIAESGPRTKRVKRLAIMDQDGARHRFLSDGSELVLTPRFAPNRQEITYLSITDNLRVFLLDIETMRKESLGAFEGMYYAPRYGPDSRSMVLSYATFGNSDVWRLHLRRRQFQRLTTHPAIDTSPSFSPDGRRIVFASDRSGSPQLYVMQRDGSAAKRISFGEGQYSTPVWSPRGDLIAFTRTLRGNFAIGVMRPDGSAERVLDQAFHVEGPNWSPNGRVLIYFSEFTDSKGEFRSRLFSIDLTGFNKREIATPMDASDPAWSPLLR